jgi:hypothetical protein
MSVLDETKHGPELPGNDPDLLARVMRVYLPHCRYLKSAVLSGPPAPTATGEFEIGDSCYIDDTGHFNAVEFNICYNQLAYYLIAGAVKEGLLPVFEGWNLDDFWRLQLPSILITEFHSVFKKQMVGERLSGSVTITEVRKLNRSERWNELVVLQTSCRFWDEAGGHSRGTAKLAITNPGRP